MEEKTGTHHQDTEILMQPSLSNDQKSEHPPPTDTSTTEIPPSTKSRLTPTRIVLWLLRQIVEFLIHHALGCIPTALYKWDERSFISTWAEVFRNAWPGAVPLKIAIEISAAWKRREKVGVENV